MWLVAQPLALHHMLLCVKRVLGARRDTAVGVNPQTLVSASCIQHHAAHAAAPSAVRRRWLRASWVRAQTESPVTGFSVGVRARGCGTFRTCSQAWLPLQAASTIHSITLRASTKLGKPVQCSRPGLCSSQSTKPSAKWWRWLSTYASNRREMACSLVASRIREHACARLCIVDSRLAHADSRHLPCAFRMVTRSCRRCELRMAVSVDAAGARGVVQRRADVTASGVLPHGQDERAPGVCTRIRRRRLVRVVRLPPIRSAGALLPSIRASKLCLVCAGILAADKAVTSEAETCNASGAKYGRAYRACLGSALSRLLAAMLRAERQRCQHPSSDTWSLWSLTWNSENADCNDGQRRCSVLTKISACRNDARQKARTGGVRTGVRPSLDGETQPSKRSTASRRQAALPHRTAQAKAQVEHVDCGRWSRASVLELEHWVEHDPACAPLTRRVHTVTPPRVRRLLCCWTERRRWCVSTELGSPCQQCADSTAESLGGCAARLWWCKACAHETRDTRLLLYPFVYMLG